MVYIAGSIIFANTQQIEAIGPQTAGRRSVFFSLRGVSYMDISGAQAFLDLIRRLQSQGTQIFLCGVSAGVRQVMDRSGISRQAGEEAFFWGVEQALTQEAGAIAPAAVKK